jgi:hypothetical protein
LKFSKILNELTAAEKAHQMGYSSAGYDKWQKDGKIVARTVNGELVPIGVDDVEPADDPALAPTTTSAKAAGKVKPLVVTVQDAKKLAGQDIKKALHHKNKKDNDLDNDGLPNSEEIPHFAPRNPYGVQPLPFGRPLEDYEMREEFSPSCDPYDMLKPIHAEEEFYVLSESEWGKFMYAKEFNHDEIDQMGKEVAMRQKDEWRSKIEPNIALELAQVQNDWQAKGQYDSSPDWKEERNSFLNLVANGKPRAMMEGVQQSMERGMILDKDSLKEFLSAFTIGEDMELPPSGFSLDPALAREFARPAYDQAGVIIRMAPNRQGQLYGISLAFNGNPNYDYELEVIRTQGPKARCTAIRKLICDPRTELMGRVRVVYVIELEERGYEKDFVDEAKKKQYKNPVFERIMNTSFGACAQSGVNPVNESKLQKLRRILKEGKASEQAHALGLKYKGHGYWMDKSGKTVAVTKNDKLVKLTPDDQAYVDKKDSGQVFDKNGPVKFDSNDGFRHFGFLGHPDHEVGEPYGENVTKGSAKNIMHKKFKEATGSNPGGFFAGVDGIDRYVKLYPDPAQTCGEVLANNIYHDLDIDAPESQYFELVPGGSIAFASVIVPNVVGDVADVGLQPKVVDGILKGFAADCLVANWDALGIDSRNMVITKDGKVVRIDNGGSFLNRAMGERKPKDVLNNCTELTNFVSQNAAYSKVFKKVGITHYSQLGDKLVNQIKDIVKLAVKAGGWDKYVEQKVPDLNPQDRQEIVKMLYERTKLLLQVAQDLQKGPHA